VKKIEAIIKPCELDEIKTALLDLHIDGMTVSEVTGIGRQNGHTEIYRGRAYTVSTLAQLKAEIVVSDARVTEAVAALVKAVRGTDLGEGGLFISSVEEAIRIRTEETGDRAL
jgi:nitrogen regulatory protein PII